MRRQAISAVMTVILALASVAVQAQTWKIGAERDFPPYNFTKDGEWTGLDTDIVQAVFKAQGYDVMWLNKRDWKGLYNDSINDVCLRKEPSERAIKVNNKTVCPSSSLNAKKNTGEKKYDGIYQLICNQLRKDHYFQYTHAMRDGNTIVMVKNPSIIKDSAMKAKIEEIMATGKAASTPDEFSAKMKEALKKGNLGKIQIGIIADYKYKIDWVDNAVDQNSRDYTFRKAKNNAAVVKLLNDANNVHVIIGDEASYQLQIKQQNINADNAQAVHPPLKVVPRYFGFHHGDTQSVAMFNDGLKKIKMNGKYCEVINKWMPSLDCQKQLSFNELECTP